MNRKRRRKWCLPIAVTIVITSCLGLCLLGCFSNNNENTPFQIAFTSLYVNENALSDFGAYLLEEIPELNINGKPPLFTPMIMGEVRNDIESGILNDPMMGIGGMMRITASVAAGEIDMVISDLENAARNARGGLFLPLDEIFTDGELAAFDDRLLSFDLLNTDGYEATPTGEKTPLCGIAITSNEELRNIFANQEIGVFVIANTKNIELVRKVITALL